MRTLEANTANILSELKGRKLVVMLDFDGTLAPFVDIPSDAKMSEHTESLVRGLANIVPVYIVSGRSLEDLKERVSIEGVKLAGNHGMEWQDDKGEIVQRVEAPALADIVEARVALSELAAKSGALLENKGLSIAFHYRAVPSQIRSHAVMTARKLLEPLIERGRIEVLDQKRLLDIRPIGWHKGDYAKEIMRQHKDAACIYIGDDATDEDAFRALPDGITIRVGKKSDSAAAYFVKTRDDVDTFLEALLKSRN